MPYRTTPPQPTVRNPATIITANIGVPEDTALEGPAAPYNPRTMRWLATGSIMPAATSSRSRKDIYDTLMQTLYDKTLIDRFAFLALLQRRTRRCRFAT